MTRACPPAWPWQSCITGPPAAPRRTQILRLEAPAPRGAGPQGGAAAALAAASGALAHNQALEGHDTAVTAVAWNGPAQKLASADEGGLIIVWVLQDGAWGEEMVNNRCGRVEGRGFLGGELRESSSRRLQQAGRHTVQRCVRCTRRRRGAACSAPARAAVAPQ